MYDDIANDNRTNNIVMSFVLHSSNVKSYGKIHYV